MDEPEACTICHERAGKHQCFQCNETYTNLADLIAHQKKRSHFGGHHILSRPSLRHRRLPVRFRDPDLEIEIDENSGAHGIRYDSDQSDDELSIETNVDESNCNLNESEEECATLPDLPGNFFSRKRQRPDTGDHVEAPAQLSTSTGLEIPARPKWVENLQLSGIDFNESYKLYWCQCGKTPAEGWKTGGSSGNIKKHRLGKSCTFDKLQTRIGEKPRKKAVTQADFRKAIANAVVSCNFPFSVVANPDFRHLLTMGNGRQHLKVPSRNSTVKDINDLNDKVSMELNTSISRRTSKLSITFDLWTDRVSRGFLAVTGHYFDADMNLRAPLLGIKHFSKSDEGHTGLRIFEAVRSILLQRIGQEWATSLQCSVTDGASNVTSASKMLGSSRRCLQHSVQLFIKYFCSGSKRIASSLACCNYLAKTTKTSQKLRAAIGNIPAGVVTRWNSYLMSAVAVYDARMKLNEYVSSVRCASDVAKMLQPRLDYLNKGGFRVLHDVSVVLKPLADLTIDEEGELYVSSSTVIPRLIAARAHMTTVIDNALKNDRSGHKIIDPKIVGTWKEQVHELWDMYLESFLDDELFLCATLLDPRNGCGLNLTYAIAKNAERALRKYLQQRFKTFEDERFAQVENDPSDIQLSSKNAGAAVANSRSHATRGAQIPANVVAHLFGNRDADASPVQTGIPDYNNVKDELRELHKTVTSLNVFEKWNVDPMILYRGDCKLKLSKSVALDVLSIPAGEAPSERIFSIASRVIKFDRSSMGAEQVSTVTFIKKNSRALHIDQ